jgi:D-3-phosphoglycerate dehydrogenase
MFFPDASNPIYGFLYDVNKERVMARKKIVAAGDRVYLKFFDLQFFHDKAREARAEFVPFRELDNRKFKQEIADADALVLIDRPLTAEHVGVMKKCAIVLALEVGYDFIDVKAATGKGIVVSNVPAYCRNQVAVHAFTLMLAAYRKLKVMIGETAGGGWNYKVGEPLFETAGKTLGIVGLGRIGRSLVPKARGFDIQVAAYDPYLDDDVFDLLGVQRCFELDELLRDADIVSLHVPLTGETFHMIGEHELSIMKPEAVLVNTCRGKIVEEKALYEALTTGRIAGCGLDVLEIEPPAPDNPLLKLNNALVTPHAAKEQGMDEVVRVLNGKRPWYIVNPEVLAG